MAVVATAVWRIRTGGSNTNGGGYDPGLGGSTDYSQQDAAQATGTLGTAAGTTAFSDAGGAFTSAMVGNALWIASGAGFTVGAYFITAFTSATAVTLDRSPGTGTVANWAVGGGWVDPKTNITGTPAWIVPGNVIFIRSSGGSHASPDYTIPSTFISPPAGDNTNGKIRFVGENGRAWIKGSSGSALIFFNGAGQHFENLGLIANGSTNGNVGVLNTAANVVASSVKNVIVDQNGNDNNGISITGTVDFCEVYSSVANAGAAGTKVGILMQTYGDSIRNCNIHDCWGIGVNLNSMGSITGSIVAKCKGDGILVSETNAAFCQSIHQNTIDANANGITFNAAVDLGKTSVTGNLITNNTTNGIKCNFGSTAANDRIRSDIDYNSYFNNGTNALNLTVGTGTVNGSALHDNIGTDPQYTGQSTENYAIGTNLKALGDGQGGFLQSIGTNTSGVTSYLDPGGVQRQEAGGGGGVGYLIAGGLIGS